MILSRLLAGIEYAGMAGDDEGGLPVLEINSIVCDSRQVERGSVFFCIKGEKYDGHDHAADAIKKGAAAVVTERDLGLRNQVVTDNTRLAWGIACGNYFGNPARRLRLLGVTGTNGKTSVTYMIKQILESAGKKAGLIGTIQNEIADMVIPAKHTTPDPYQLHAMLERMVAAGCEYAVMEVSSHALEQNRVAGCQFAAAAFTNLTQDHLDFHGDMENYYEAKKKLFSMCGTAVINYDDKYGRRLLGEIECEKMTFSCENDEAGYVAKNIKFTAQESSFVILHGSGLTRARLPMPGLFSVYNALTAALVCVAAGIPYEDAINGLAAFKGVPGRLEVLPSDTPFTIIRDYAHSPDGIEKALTAVRAFAPARIVILFGCAGNRDRTKRPLMAEIASRLADFCILTSDNPRDEDPEQIIGDAMPGLKKHGTPYKVIADRYDAIRWALENCREGDVLVLAGKGHEDYQVLNYGTIFFDEKAIVAELLEKIKNGD